MSHLITLFIIALAIPVVVCLIRILFKVSVALGVAYVIYLTIMMLGRMLSN